MKDAKNERCPFRMECEKKCTYQMRELECDYYSANAMPGAEIEDQEEMRFREEEQFGGCESFSDAEAASEENSGLIMLPVSRLHPHKDNPRKELGDLSELADSIRANGIFQNLTVVPDDPESSITDFTVVIGHRRLAAAMLAGVDRVPCVVAEMSPSEQLQTMLMENMQRSDLTVYEQAQGFQMMLDMGSTVDEIAEKSGFSSTTVRRRLEIAKLDGKTLQKVSERQLSLGDFDDLAKIDDMETRNKVLKSIGTANFQNELRIAIDAQKWEKRMEEWIAKIREFAEECEDANYSSHQFCKSYNKWNMTEEVTAPEDAETTKYVYKVDSTSVNIYKERDKEKEDAEQEERNERNRIAELRRSECVDVNNRHYKLRSEFVKNLANTDFKKQFGKVAMFCAYVMGDKLGGYNASIDIDVFAHLTGLKVAEDDTDDAESITEIPAIQTAMEAFPEKALFVLAYSVCDDNGKGYWTQHWNGGQYEYTFRENSTLDALYEILEEFGYELSDEERQAKTGRHPLFPAESEKSEEA